MTRQAIALLLVVLAAACRREARPNPSDAVAAVSRQMLMPVLSDIHPGGAVPPAPTLSPFQDNAYGISEGKRLFVNYNCAGCHAHGGGGMGPALMDDRWIYGSRPDNIFATIVEGRPNGMPSFRGKIVDTQIWQLVAYVQSMSGQSSLDSLPGRSDHLTPGTSENGRSAEVPRQTGAPQ
jgi:cytochrome c oxidase cbb3-type subunit 3